MVSTAITAGVTLFALVAILIWAYWPNFEVMSRKWAVSSEYSHGFLVPLFCVGLLYVRRRMLDLSQWKPSWWGLPLLLIGLAGRHLATYYYMEWFEFLSLLPCLFGICLLVGGWQALRWAWPALAFTIFMIPLPYTLEVAMRDPLRRIGTVSSTYVMQVIGLPAYAEGNVIIVDDVRIGVVEACSGLNMLMMFFALSTLAVFLCDRPYWQRGIILLSALPIAIASNVVRIASTGTLHALHYSELADLVFHDLAGLLMMPIALAMLWFEFWALGRIVLVEKVQPMTIGLPPSLSASSDRSTVSDLVNAK